MLDWGAILSGSSAAAVVLITFIVIIRSMGSRLLSIHDSERQTLKESLGELRHAVDNNQKQLAERTNALEKRQEQIKYDIVQQHKDFEQKVIQRFSDLPDKYVPRRELGAEIDNIKETQEHIKDNIDRVNESVEAVRDHVMQR